MPHSHPRTRTLTSIARGASPRSGSDCTGSDAFAATPQPSHACVAATQPPQTAAAARDSPHARSTPKHRERERGGCSTPLASLGSSYSRRSRLPFRPSPQRRRSAVRSLRRRGGRAATAVRSAALLQGILRTDCAPEYARRRVRELNARLAEVEARAAERSGRSFPLGPSGGNFRR
jgi:hypothetical protein